MTAHSEGEPTAARPTALGVLGALVAYLRHDTNCCSEENEGSGPCTCGLQDAHFAYAQSFAALRAAPGPTNEDTETILEDVYRHLREPCTLGDAREARLVVAHHLNTIKKDRLGAARAAWEPTPDEPPHDSLRQAWPWAVYTTAYGLRIRHQVTGTELDFYDASRKLNDYDSVWRER